MSALDRVKLIRLAFGIRYNNHFRIEDSAGEIIDDILGSDGFGVERFTEIGYGAGLRQLMNKDKTETISIGRNDTIFESKAANVSLDELGFLSEQFLNIIWSAVCRNSKPPEINRYGCMIGFNLPETWQPIQVLLGQEYQETSEFDFRYSKRLPVMDALANATVNDYWNSIFSVSCHGPTRIGTIDYQRYFIPALESEKTRRENPYERFVERAVAYCRGQGWQLLEGRIGQIARAA